MSKRSLSIALPVLALITALVTGCNGRQFEQAVSAGATKTSTAFAKVDDGVRSSATKTSTAFAWSDDRIRSTATSTSRAFSDLDSGRPRLVLPPNPPPQRNHCESSGTVVVIRDRHEDHYVLPSQPQPVVGPALHAATEPPLTDAAARAARDRLLAVPIGAQEDALWVAAGLNLPPPIVVMRWPNSSNDTPYQRGFLAPGCEIVWRRDAGHRITVAPWCEGPGWKEPTAPGTTGAGSDKL